MLLAFWVAALTGGVAGALSLPTEGAGALAALGLGVGAWLAARRRLVGGGAGLGLAMGVALGLLAARPPTFPAPIAAALGEGHGLNVRGTVLSGPWRSGPGGGRRRLLVEVDQMDGQPVAADMSLTVVAGSPRVLPGDRVAFRARVREPLGLANPGLPDERLLSRARGVDLLASLGRADELVRIARGPWWAPRRLAARLHAALAAAVDRELPVEVAGFLRGVVLGERTTFSESVEAGFRAAGATHVLSVSGLHLAAVAAAVFFLLRRAAGLSVWLALRCEPSRVAALASAPALWVYTLVTGEAVATWRSLLMAAVALGAVWLRRPVSAAAAIASAALVLLVDSPLCVLDVSFQLSFVSVVALAAFASKGRGQGAKPARGVWGRVGRHVVTALRASAAAGIATAPLLAHHFGELTPAAPAGNLLLVPLVELVVVPLGLLGAALGIAHPLLGALPLEVAGCAARVALAIARLFEWLGPLVLVRSPTGLETGALLGAALLSLLAWRARGTRRARRWPAAAGVLAGFALVSLAARDVLRRTSDEVRVTFLDVGQGDAAVIEGPRGFVAIIDGGGTYDGAFDPGALIIEPYLRRRGIGRIDLMALSHPHPDHLQGLFRLVERFEVAALWTSGDDGHNPEYARLVQAARAKGIPLPRPREQQQSGLVVAPLGPFVGDDIGAPPGTSVNDASLVVRAAYAGRSVLFSGDLEEDGEAELVGRAALGLRVSSDVLKVPHHGSRTSSTPAMLDAARPSVAVISLGRNNRFGFPRREVLARYAARGIRVLRTDVHGAVSVTLHPDSRFDATCARGCR